MKHAEFQEKAMQTLLAGDDEVLKGLRNQYVNSTITSVEFTGAGFYANFTVRPEIPPVAGGKTFQIDDVDAIMNGERSSIGLILFVKDGYLSMLEGYTLAADIWPDDYSRVLLVYDSPSEVRDMARLRQNWA